MFSLEFWVISTQKCEVVSFCKFESAGVPVRPFEYLGVPFYLWHMCHAHALMTHMPIMTSQGLHMM